MWAAAAAMLAAACSAPAEERQSGIALTIPADNPARAYVKVVGLAPSDLDALRAQTWDHDRWAQLLHVSVRSDPRGPAIAGRYAVERDAVEGDELRFVPTFPLDPGRDYTVVFDPAKLPSPSSKPPVFGNLSRPALIAAPSTVVRHVYPSGDEIPENQLRMYIHFSAPMGLRGGLDHIALEDEAGREVRDPFLPLDMEFWNDDRTRYTLFFDPGRQKRGIMPNRDLGRSLEAGRTYTLVVKQSWLDGNGKPLADEYRRRFRVTPADEHPLDQAAWRIVAPSAGTRDPLTVWFPEPLDHGLLLRAIGVQRTADGREWTTIAGEASVHAGETHWSFVAAQPWVPGQYQLAILSILEDRAGNRIGRAFEVDTFRRADSSAEPARVTRPFTIAAQ